MNSCVNIIYVNVPSCPAAFCETSASVRGLRSLAFCCVRSCTRASACFELALVRLCGQRSSVVHMCADPSCLLWRRSAFEHSFWIVFPYPSLFPLYILYQCDGCPSSLLRGGSWLGCQDCQPWEQSHLGAGCQ